jgi:hypothetical protein
MKPQLIRRLALGTIILTMIIFPAFHSISAQEASPNQPLLTLTLCIVGETEACPPNGYKDYSLDEPSNCPTLRPEDVEDWIHEKPAHQFVNIPPTEIKLGGRMLEALATYRNENPASKPPSQRESMVLMFEFKNLQDSAVSIHRVTKKNYTTIPPRTWNGRLDSEKRLIYHERADAFFPGYNIKWIITVGGKHWTLRTGG